MQETEDIVARLQNERRATRWTRGVDTDYPVAWEPHPLCAEAATTIATLRAEVEGLRADAERYRWLKHKAPGEIVFDHINDDHRFELYVPFDGNPIDNDEESNARLDAAIDAAKADKEVA